MSTEDNKSNFESTSDEWVETFNQSEDQPLAPSTDSQNAASIVIAQTDDDEISPVDAAGSQGNAGQGGANPVPPVINANADNQVFLPASFSLENAIISGDDLILIQPDGSEVTIKNAALNVPTFVIDGVEIPQEALIAAFAGSGINIAAGPNGNLVASSGAAGSGANFILDPGGIGDAGPVLDLLGPTGLQFPVLEQEDLFPGEVQEEASIAASVAPLAVISVLPASGDTENGVLEDPDLDGVGTTPDEDGETDRFIATVQAGTSDVTDVVFDPFNGSTGPLSQMSTGVSGVSTSAVFTYDLSTDGHTLIILADGVPVVELVIDFTPGTDDIAPQEVGEIDIIVTLLEGFPHEFASDVDAIIEGVPIMAHDAEGFTDVGDFSFVVVDDVPTVSAVIAAEINAALDEGDQDVGSPATSSASVIDTGTITKGDDPDVANAGGVVISSGGSASALVDLTTVFGADGPASVDSTQYSFTFTSVASGLSVTDGSSIILVDANGDGLVIVGQVSGGAFDGQAAFAMAIDPDTGVVTVEQYLSLAHPNQHDGSPTGTSYDETVDLSGSDLGVLSVVTDDDGDEATAIVAVGGRISFDDDGPLATAELNYDVVANLDEGDQDVSSPSTGVTAGIDTGSISKGDDPDVVNTGGDAIASAVTSDSLLDVTAFFGADGPAVEDSIQYAFSFSSDFTGLSVTDGSSITLNDVHGDGSVIVGQVSGGDFDGQAAFALSIDPDTGIVTVEQYLSLDHPSEAAAANGYFSYDEAVSLYASDLQVVAVVTDGDGDQVIVSGEYSEEQETPSTFIGGQIIFEDDGPIITVEVNDDAPVALDEGDTDTGSPSTGVASVISTAGTLVTIPKGDDPDVVNTGGAAIASGTSGEAIVDATALFGADGPAVEGSLQYAFVVDTGWSNLTVTDGSSIILVDINGDGSVIVGEVVGGGFDGDAAFALQIDPDTGIVTVEQYLSLAHPDQHDGTPTGESYDEAIDLSGSALSVAVTATDGDGDQTTVTTSVEINDERETITSEIGAQITFDDDGPDAEVEAVSDSGITLVTQDAETDGDPTSEDTASASFETAFLAAVVPDYGADGAAASNPVVLSAWALAITGGNGTDSLLDSQGENITLSIVSGDVVGSTTSFGEIFRISVDGSGNVTVTQSQQIDHLPESLDTSNDNANIALSDGLVTLSATATVTDFDNDQATTTVSADLGSNISFDDDVPSVTANAVADAGITLVTQDADTIGVASDTDSASFASAFLAAVVPDYGADGAAASNPVVLSAWALAITGGNGTDSLLDSQGENITLSIVSGDVVGSTTSFGEIFRISVDGSGNVTVTQSQQIDHLPESLDTSNDNANIALSDGLVTLSATATVTDFDNDQATTTVSADLGSNISFDDDVPSVTANAVADAGITLVTQDADTIGVASDTDSASFASAFLAAVVPDYGADGAAASNPVVLSAWALAITGGNGTDSLLDSQGENITLSIVSGDVVGSTTSFGEIFRISVDGSGNVTVTQSQQIDHLPESLDTSNDIGNASWRDRV
ncbi:hypothetical protein LP7551_02975 [Roseibium album]|nr:hypothetical protein LP7551_02975 [Roseibium album]